MAAVNAADVYATPDATLTDTIPDVKQGIFTTQGRLGVLQYWAHSAILMLLSIAIFLAAGSFVNIGADGLESSASIVVLSMVILPVIGLVTVGIIMFIKRLHDINMSAWYFLLTLIPVIGSVFSLYVMCMPGSNDANQYGPATETKVWEQFAGAVGLILCIALLLFALAMPILGIGES